MRRLLTLTLCVAALLASAAARAQEQPPPIQGTAFGRFLGGLWPQEPARWFLGIKADLGYAYIRPRLNAGYGSPHRHWLGLDVNPTVSTSAAGGYAGFRYENPYADLRTGALLAYSFNRSYLPILPTYDLRAAELRGSDNAVYVAWDSELELNIPAGFGSVLSETQPTYIGRVPDDRYVFVENLRVISGGPWTLRQRLGYSVPIPWVTGLNLAAVGEVIVLPERDTQVWRAGITLRWWLFKDLQVRINMVPVVSSPDNLGLAGADLGQIGVRWFWATH